MYSVSTIPTFLHYASDVLDLQNNQQSNIQSASTIIKSSWANIDILKETLFSCTLPYISISANVFSNIQSNINILSSNVRTTSPNIANIRSNLTLVYSNISSLWSNTARIQSNLNIVFSNIRLHDLNVSFTDFTTSGIYSRLAQNTFVLFQRLEIFSEIEVANLYNNLYTTVSNVYSIYYGQPQSITDIYTNNMNELNLSNSHLRSNIIPLTPNLTLVYSNINFQQSNISNLQNSYAISNILVSNIQSNLTLVYSNISNLYSTFASLRNSLNFLTRIDNTFSLSTNLAVVYSNISNLQTPFVNIDSNINEIQSNILSTPSNVTELQISYEISNTNVLDILSNVSLVYSDISNLISYFGNLNTSLSLAQLLFYQTDNTFSLSANLDVVYSNISNLKTSFININSNINEIQSNILSTPSNVTELQFSYTVSNILVSNILSNVSLVYSNISNLISSVGNLQTSNTLLWSNVTSLGANVGNIWSNLFRLEYSNAFLWSNINNITQNLHSNAYYINARILPLSFEDDSNITVRNQAVSFRFMSPVIIYDSSSIISYVVRNQINPGNSNVCMDIQKNGRSIYNGLINTLFTNQVPVLYRIQGSTLSNINVGVGVSFLNGVSQVFNTGDVLTANIIGAGSAGAVGAKVNILYSQL